ncbi:MAG: hypothetical protein CMG34_07790 [Candidatus Marinimicrobia bacterium]|nr:hypothetical protein [Candidatus Neomarinimicrobiota bacterium]|tara:strand:+ start:8176 stop:8868 length:693 start_codon:yes stop_codon:yes gene_type:complete
MSDLNDIMQEFGISPLSVPEKDVPSPFETYVRYNDPDAVIIPASERPEALKGAMAGTEQIGDLTVGDIYQQYFDMSEDQRKSLHERLFVSGFYSKSTKTEDIHNKGQAENAFVSAVNFYAAQGINPLSQEALPTRPIEVELEEEPVTRRATEDQISTYADSAAKNIFGRAASDSEKELAVSIFRKLEDDEASSPGMGDLTEGFKAASPEEAANRRMAKTLNMFQKIVAGA